MGKPHALNVSDWGFESLAAYCDYSVMDNTTGCGPVNVGSIPTSQPTWIG